MQEKLTIEPFSPTTLLISPRAHFYEAEIATELKKQVIALLTKEIHSVLLNLANIKYIDSFGLASLLSVLKTCRELGGTLVLMHPNSTVLQLIHLTKLSTILPVVETKAEALALLS
jgi:anti-anti-sigma factor